MVTIFIIGPVDSIRFDSIPGNGHSLLIDDC
jgi:hypothetical protein